MSEKDIADEISEIQLGNPDNAPEQEAPQEIKVDAKEVLKNTKVEADPDAKPADIKNKKGEELDAATAALYTEFNSFLETKADIKEDIGEKMTIPTGIKVFDAILGGGFAVGALNIVVGQPGSGKSMMAIQAMGGGQQKYDGLIASFLDSEEATSTIRLSNLGVRRPRIKPRTDITVEKVFKFLETMAVFKEQKKINDIPSVVVWDSIANTLSEREREVDDINAVIGYKARLLSILIPKYVAKCAQHNICFIAVNQLRDKISIGPFSAPKDLRFLSTGKDMPGGTVLKYNAFNLVEMKAKSVLEPEKYGFEGIMVACKTVKSKAFPPNVEVNLVGSFVTGFSDFWTSYHFLADNKRLQTGAWNYLKDDPDQKKFRTKDAELMYKEEPKFRDMFDKAVEECIQVELIEKYNPIVP